MGSWAVRVFSLLVICGLAISLASCGPRRLSAEDYQELVIHTLRGEGDEKGLPLPGLKPAIDHLLAALSCVEVDCHLPDEFSYIGDVAELVEIVAADYRGKICDKQVHPPRKMEDDHRLICESLDEMRKAADMMKITARLAAQLLSQESTAPELMSKNYSAKLIEHERSLIKVLQNLRGITWLNRLFEEETLQSHGRSPGGK